MAICRAQEGTLGEFSLLYAIIDCDFNVESIESGSLADFTINALICPQLADNPPSLTLPI